MTRIVRFVKKLQKIIAIYALLDYNVYVSRTVRENEQNQMISIVLLFS